MREILIVGIGSGNPEHMTIQAINALNRADVIFIPIKGHAKAELADIRREIISRFVTNRKVRIVEYMVPERQTVDRTYNRSVDDWHAAITSIYVELFRQELDENGVGAFLVWGDPMLYDSTIRIIERVKSSGGVAFDHMVVPGITSLQALCASHKIPLNLVGKPVEITTGRCLAGTFPAKTETVAVMLDGQQAFKDVDDPDAEIFWGAYLGTGHEIIISGRLSEKKEEILRARAEAREQNGWIMDIYLLRKGTDFDEA